MATVFKAFIADLLSRPLVAIVGTRETKATAPQALR
jgi:hypothetical protein